MGVACCANYPASQSILPNSQTVTMLLCRDQLYLAPKRTIARPSKTQERATQDIQSSIHPERANPLAGRRVGRPEALRWAWHSARTIQPRNRSYPIPKQSPCSCAESSSTSPPIAPSHALRRLRDVPPKPSSPAFILGMPTRPRTSSRQCVGASGRFAKTHSSVVCKNFSSGNVTAFLHSEIGASQGWLRSGSV